MSEVALIRCEQSGSALDGLQEAALFVVEGLGGVHDDQDESGIGEGFAAASDAELLGLFDSFAKAGGIDQFQRNAIERDAFGDQVAGGARSCRDDGAFSFDEAIEQGAFANIGTAHDGEGESIVHDAAATKGGFEVGEGRGQARRCAKRCRPAGATSTSSSAKSMPASRRAMSSTRECLAGATRRLSAPPIWPAA